MITMKARAAAAVLALCAGVVWGGPDNYAAGAGGTSPVNLNAVTQSGAYGNPALLGLGRVPRGGLTIPLPIPPLSYGAWSNELVYPVNNDLFNFDEYDAAEYWSRYLSWLLIESFGLRDVKNNPEEVSRRLTRGMKDGVGLYSGFSISPFVLSMDGFSLGLRTYSDGEVRLPGGILLPLFSYEDGLMRGKALDFSSFNVGAIVATEAAVKFGWPLSGLPLFFDYLPFNRGAWGVGVKHVIGHAYYSIRADEGSSLRYADAENKYRMSAKIDVAVAAMGLRRDGESYDFDSTILTRPAAGSGWGFDLGAVFHNDRHFVSVDMQDIGMILWDGSKMVRQTLWINMDDMDLNDLLGNFVDSIIDMSAVADTSGNDYVSYLPMSLNLGYTYYYDLSYKPNLKYLVRYLTASAGLKQQIINGPGKNSKTPILSFGGTAGVLNGVLPLRYGFAVGGPGKYSSVAGAGLNARAFSIDAYWRAAGHPFFVPKKGFEAAAAVTVHWGWDKKKKSREDIFINLYNRARRLQYERKYWDAFFVYSRILSEYPDFFKNDWVALFRAECQERLDMRGQAAANYNKVKEAYPAGETAPYADLGLMKIDYRNGDFAQAANRFAGLNGPDAPDSLRFHGLYLMGQIHLQNDEIMEALRAFSAVPEGHPDYVFAQHASAAALASIDSGMKEILAALENAVGVSPQTPEEQEAVNRSYLFMGLLYYEESQFSKAVDALRQVPEGSYYYEDALLGLGWTALKSRQWNDCIAAGRLLAGTARWPAPRAEGMLIEAYGHVMQKDYLKAFELIEAGHAISLTFQTPSADSLAARGTADAKIRQEYSQLSDMANELSMTKQTARVSRVLDSLKNRGGEYGGELDGYGLYRYEHRRGTFFAASNDQVKDDLEYALLIIGSTGAVRQARRSTAQPTSEIDAEIEALKRQMEEMGEGSPPPLPAPAAPSVPAPLPAPVPAAPPPAPLPAPMPAAPLPAPMPAAPLPAPMPAAPPPALLPAPMPAAPPPALLPAPMPAAPPPALLPAPMPAAPPPPPPRQ